MIENSMTLNAYLHLKHNPIHLRVSTPFTAFSLLLSKQKKSRQLDDANELEA